MYLTTGMIQAKLIEVYKISDKKQDFITVVIDMYNSGNYLDEKPLLPEISWDNLSDDNFLELLSSLPVNLSRLLKRGIFTPPPDADTLPSGTDVFVHKYYNYISSSIHTHGFFEIGYVLKGSCKLIFKKEEHILTGGEFYFVASGTEHDLIIEDEKAIIINISTRKATFSNSFFNLLTQEDLLSYFFGTILFNKVSSNYMIFKTNNSNELRSIIKNLIIENRKNDFYSNNCSVSWINILFATIVRNYSHTVTFGKKNVSGTSFYEILKYIQMNYQSVSLKSLADDFHYSQQYLSSLIKKNTGYNLTTLINKIKLSRAVDYLKNTKLTLSEIAEQVGYNSEDYFSKVFKRFYNESPQQYRKKHFM